MRTEKRKSLLGSFQMCFDLLKIFTPLCLILMVARQDRLFLPMKIGNEVKKPCAFNHANVTPRIAGRSFHQQVSNLQQLFPIRS